MNHRDLQGVIDDAVGQLLDAWSESHRPSVRTFLPLDEPLRYLTLLELVLTDMEVVVRTGCADLVQQYGNITQCYLCTFPELSLNRTFVSELFSREFRFRRKSGENLSWNAFRKSVSDEYLDGLTPYSSTPFIDRRGPDGPSSDLELLPGAEFDHFRIIEKLGEGAFANVWLARQFERFVALKIPKNWDDHWTKEASLLSGLEHPHIVSVHDARVLESVTIAVLVMQYHPGGSLRNAIDQVRLKSPVNCSGGTLRNIINEQLVKHGDDLLPIQASPPFGYADWSSVVCWIGARLADALDHAHCCTPYIIHGDIKPENVLFARDGRPLLADFNVSFRRCEGGVDASGDDFGGSWPYMSPEQLEVVNAQRTLDNIDARSDVFSLGILLWELATGRNPFHRQLTGAPQQAVADLISERKVGADSLPGCGELPRSLQRILSTCLAPDPGDRETAARIARRLHLASLPETRELLWPHEHSWVRFVTKRPILVLSACGVLPNVAFVKLNMEHNKGLIDKFSELSLDPYRRFIILVLFGITVSLLLVYSKPVMQRIREEQLEQSGNVHLTDREVIYRCLRKSWIDWQAILIVWTLSGIILLAGYDFSGAELASNDSWSREKMGWYMNVAFYSSQIVFGMVAASLTAISICFIDVHCLIPVLVRNSAIDDLRSELTQYSMRLNWYVFTLGLAQLIVFWRLGWFGPVSGNLLTTLAFAFAFSFVLGIYIARRISSTLEVLRLAVTPARELFSSVSTEVLSSSAKRNV